MNLAQITVIKVPVLISGPWGPDQYYWDDGMGSLIEIVMDNIDH